MGVWPDEVLVALAGAFSGVVGLLGGDLALMLVSFKLGMNALSV